MSARMVVTLSFVALGATAPSDSTRWRTEIDGGANRDDHAVALVIDGNGDAIAAGDVIRAGDLSRLAVAKFDGSTGAVLWESAAAGTGDSFDSRAEAVALDAEGDVYAAGTLDMRRTSQDFAVAKFRGEDGSALWRVTLDAGFFGTDQANDVVVDASGDVIAGGYVTRTNVQHFTVVKLDGATGTRRWRTELAGELPFRTQANAVAVDARGDVIAAGSIARSGRAEDFTVVKLDGATGAVVWRLEVDGTGNYQDEAYGLAFDSAGDILVSGFIFGAASVQDFAVLKLDGATGREVWRRTLNGQANWADHGWTVAIDSKDDVVAAGQIHRRNRFWADFSVVKLDGATGRTLWQWMRGGEATANAWAVAVDPNDRVVAAGEIQGPGTKTDFTVIFLDGASGRLLRDVGLDGTDRWFDVAYDVALNDEGAVIAAGWFINRQTGSDLAVVRLR